MDGVVCTLILAVASLHLLVRAFLHFPFEYTGSSRLVVVGDLEDMCGIDPIVRTSTHYMIATDIEFIDRYL